MGQLRKGAGLGSVSARKLQRVLELQNEKFGPASQGGIDVQRQYIYAIGRNECGFDLVPGAPVRIGSFTPQESTNVMPRIGWYGLTPAYLPRSTTEYSDTRENMWSIGVMLDYCANLKLARFAISGVVDCKIDTPGCFAGLYESSDSSHQSKAKGSYAMGFARISARIDANWAKVELGLCQAERTGTAIGLIPVSASPTAPTEVAVLVDGLTGASINAYTTVVNIGGDSKLKLDPVNGRYHALKIC